MSFVTRSERKTTLSLFQNVVAAHKASLVANTVRSQKLRPTLTFLYKITVTEL